MRASLAGADRILGRPASPWNDVGKVAVVVLAGTQLPLVAVAAHLAAAGAAATPGTVLLVTAMATLFGAALTLTLLHALLAPVARAADELQLYLNTRQPPLATGEVPTGSADMAGRLLRDVRYTVAQLDALSRARDAAAATDALTGVYSQAIGERRLAEEVARVKREGCDFTLALVELDRFEALTSRFGHAVADRCLQHLAATLSGNLRQSDWVARFGGRGFLVGLIGVGDGALLPVLGRVYRALEGAPVPTPGGARLRLSISVGATQVAPADQAQELVRRAAQALDRARRRGGGTAVCLRAEAGEAECLVG